MFVANSFFTQEEYGAQTYCEPAQLKMVMRTYSRTLDYILVAKECRGEVTECRVLGEENFDRTDHRMVIIEMNCRRKYSDTQRMGKIKNKKSRVKYNYGVLGTDKDLKAKFNQVFEKNMRQKEVEREAGKTQVEGTGLMEELCAMAQDDARLVEEMYKDFNRSLQMTEHSNGGPSSK